MLRLSVAALLFRGLNAAVLTPRAGLVYRQDASSTLASESTPETLAWSSAYMDNDNTIWAPLTYWTTYQWYTSSDNYYGYCSSSYSYFTLASISSYTYSSYSSCAIYTTCSEGVLVAESTSFQCAGDGYRCVTNLLYPSWAATEAATLLGCYSTTANTSTSLYITKPAAQVSVPATTTAGPTTTPASPASTSTVPTSTGGGGGGGGGGSSNTGVIAGSVVGGVAVLAIAGVAIFWIMRRTKAQHTDPNVHPGMGYASPPSGGVPSYYQPQAEKPPEFVNAMPNYDQHGGVAYPQDHSPTGVGVGGTSPHQGTHSPVPVYPQGFTGDPREMEGSGVHAPTVRTPPPPQTGY